MYIVFVTGKCMGKRFDNPEEMGRYIASQLTAGKVVRVELFI